MILAFMAGLAIGGVIGMITTAIMAAGAREDRLREEYYEREAAYEQKTEEKAD